MQSAFEILSIRPQIKKERSKRDTIIADLYAVYSCDRQKELRRKFNWKNYIVWLKANRIKHTRATCEQFRKRREFSRELPIRTIAILMARNKEDTLYRILSEAKDMNSRSMDAWAFILSNRFV